MPQSSQQGCQGPHNQSFQLHPLLSILYSLTFTRCLWFSYFCVFVHGVTLPRIVPLPQCMHTHTHTHPYIPLHSHPLLGYLFFFFFVAERRLSLAAASGATLHCSAWATHCGGFSCCGARGLGVVRASVVIARGLSSCGRRP